MELITTFSLAVVIVVILINLVLTIKDIYSKTSIKTELYIIQGNLSNALNRRITSDDLDSYQTCNDGDFCYIFSLVNGEDVKLSITDSQIEFDDLVYKIPSSAAIGQPSLTNEVILVNPGDNYDSILNIKIPITCKLYPDIDFGINLVYQYVLSNTSLGE